MICSFCVMDATDPLIEFDLDGRCNHCKLAEDGLSEQKVGTHDWYPNSVGRQLLQQLITQVKKNSLTKPYDGILGISGGVDSCYLALKLKDLGLRILLVHVDTGWNSAAAAQNISSVVKCTGFDFRSIVVDWDEMKKLQIAFLFSGLKNLDIPQDHLIFRYLFDTAKSVGVNTFFSGGNLATESILPKSWTGGNAFDGDLVKDVYRKYWNKNLSLPVFKFLEFYIYLPRWFKIKILRPLNYMDYNKKEAVKFLEENIDWTDYGKKHGESNFTRIYQNYILPERYGIIKLKAHLSSEIVSGAITRDEALKELRRNKVDVHLRKKEIEYFLLKLDLTMLDYNKIISMEKNDVYMFKNWTRSVTLIKKLLKIFGMNH